MEWEHGSGDDREYHDFDDNADEDDVPNLAGMQYPDDPPPFMSVLDLQAMHAPEFQEYTNMASDYAQDDELHVGMQFNDMEAVIRTIKNYSISK